MPFPGRTITLNAQTNSEGIPTTPILVSRFGGGNNDRFSMGFWCFPLPPPGPLRVYVEWADVDIPETMITLDAAPIINAAQKAITLWEPED